MSLKGQKTITKTITSGSTKNNILNILFLMLSLRGAPIYPYQFTAKTDKQERHFIKEVIERGSPSNVFIYNLFFDQEKSVFLKLITSFADDYSISHGHCRVASNLIVKARLNTKYLL